MKTIKNMLYIAAMATAITACSGEESFAPEANTPITVSATIPGDVWAVASRGGEGGGASGGGSSSPTGPQYSDWTLHYTDYKGAAATYKYDATTMDGNSVTLTTGSDLVWAQVRDEADAPETFYLTCQDADGATFSATTTAQHGVENIAFATAMKPVVAKFTVNFKFVNNLGADADDFTFTFSAQGAAAYDAATHGGVCPASSTDAVTGFKALTGTTGANTCIVTGTMLLPEQKMGDELIVTYGSHNWTVDLSQVAITGTNPVQYANQLKAGQHITLNLNASLTSLGTPSIEVEAFTHGGSYDLGGEAQQPSTNP